MFAEKVTTAKLASKKFTKLMSEKPTSWGENLISVCSDITEESEQLLFLQWLADPSGSTKRHLKKIDSMNVDPKESFETCGKYNVEQVSGKVPTFHVSYRQADQEDEKELTH
jgi:hypothetical protein